MVDDDPMVLRATVRVLRSAGYEVIESTESQTCLDFIHREQPEMILLDVDMPKPDGFEVCRRIKDDPDLAGVFVILISGQRTDSHAQEQGLDNSLADGYILRPLPNPVLLARIKSFVRIRELQKERNEALASANQAQAQLLEQQQKEGQRVQTELDRVRDELTRKTRLATLGQISACIAHDLRSPLGSVYNALYLLKHYLPEPEEKILRQLQVIEEEVQRSNHIITNLLDLARDKAPDKQEIFFNECVQQQLKTYDLPEGIECRLDTEPDPFPVMVDESMLVEVLANLFTNAFEAMGDEGLLSIRACRQDNRVLLRFRDTGPGFSEEVLDKLFEPLVTTKPTGTGLGLTICQAIIEKHKGTITANNHPTKGAEICITLPYE